jgi:hypothetical protein
MKGKTANGSPKPASRPPWQHPHNANEKPHKAKFHGFADAHLHLRQLFLGNFTQVFSLPASNPSAQKREEGGHEGHPLELPAPNPAGDCLVYCCLDRTKYFATVCTNGRASAGVAWFPFKIVSKGISAPYRVRVSS